MTVPQQSATKGSTFTGNLFALANPPVAGGSLSGVTASGDTATWTWAANGLVTWNSPNGNNKAITITGNYVSTGCAGAAGITVKVVTVN